MNSFQFGVCQGQNHVTSKQIDTLEGFDLIYVVFVNIALKNGSSNNETRTDFLKKIPLEQQLVYALWILDMNVKNGGFSQYYNNSSGELLDLTLLACKKMELKEYRKIIDNANNVYLENNSKFSSTINFSNSNRTRFSELNKEYYQLERDNQIYKSISKYIKLNKKTFISN